MTPERHARIQQIFEAAVDLPPAERDSYLRQCCAGDDALRRSIEQLIAADSGTGPPTETVRVCPSCSRCFDGVVRICPADRTPLEPVFEGSLLIDKKYWIECRLGHGGMGAVYRVRHVGLEKTFALKVILGEGAILESQRAGFETEARALGHLNHPNIVNVTDYGIDPRGGGVPYLVMEYLDGETLREARRKHGPLPFDQAAPLLRAIASAIDAAHAANIIHGDLKPGNLFLARQPDGSSVLKVVDFGLARLSAAGAGKAIAAAPDGVSETAPTVTMGVVRGTPPYMAPELFRADAATRSSDLFAFGVIVYELLTGTLPFGKEGCRSALTCPPPPLPSSQASLPPELDSPILSLLAPASIDRPSSALAAVDAMDAAWLAARRREWRKREVPRRMVFSAIAAAVAILAAALAARSPVGRNLEDRIVDARFAVAPLHRPDPRLLVVAIDEPSLGEDSRPPAQWSDTVSRAIGQMFSSGAHSVAIDLLLPEPWSRSSDFSRLVVDRASQLTLSLASRDGQVMGAECIAQPVAGMLGDRYAKLFGFVRLDEDPDHTIRHSSTSFLNRDGAMSPSFAALAAGAVPLPGNAWFWIDYSVPPQAIPVISFKDVRSADPSLFQNRIILVGATYQVSNDEFPVPGNQRIPGVVLHASIVNTILQGFPVHPAPPRTCLLIAALVAFAVIAFALCYPFRVWISLLLAGGAAAIYILAAFAMFRWSERMIPVVAPVLAISLAAAAAWMLKIVLSPYPGRV